MKSPLLVALLLALSGGAQADAGFEPVYRFHNTEVKAHFFTASALEAGQVQGWFSWFRPEGVAFFVETDPVLGLAPVYRLYSLYSGAHLYTQSLGEREQLLGSGWYRDEGVAWYASATSAQGLFPVYRFYDVQNHAWHYTLSAGERAWISANLGGFREEGIAFYAWDNPRGAGVAPGPEAADPYRKD